MKCAALALVAGLAMPALAQQTELPLSRLTLYRSGVGFFERRAIVDGDADIQLNFDADQINDILKSMVLLDLGGGRIESVGYGSREPLERRLASFGIDISDNPSMDLILSRLRGAQVELDVGARSVRGVVVGVESRMVVHPDAGGVKQPFVTLLTGMGVEPVALDDVRMMRILDEELAAELEKALAAMAEQRADRVKTVDITLRGDGGREIIAAYVHEMPVWKTSYRLVLPDGSGDLDEPAGGPTIQGWAIVENTTDEDWSDVRLALVAGRPVSFQMDLYEPLHVERPEVPVPSVPGVAPRVYAGGRVVDEQTAMRARSPARESLAEDRAFAGLASKSIDADTMVEYAAQAQAAAAEAGEVFQYELKVPVTIERQRSAMLPILSAGIDGRRVSIFNRVDGIDHPMRGVEITNTSDLQLMPGPISVFDTDAYAGDAQIGHVPPGDKRLLAYAVDLQVDASIEDESRSRISRIRVVDGLIEQRIVRESVVTYAFDNKDEKRDRLIIVEQARSVGWTLKEPSSPSEIANDLYRFEVRADAGESSTLTVRQERTDYTRVQLTSFDLGSLVAYVRNGTASQEVLEAVREAARLNGAILETRRDIESIDAEVRRITEDQSRLRQNMNALDRRSELYIRYMTKLGEQETRLEAITGDRAALEAQLKTREAALAEFLRNLNVE